MGIIEIEGMEFYAYHGYFELEQKIGTRFLVDVKIETDLEKASASDELTDTLNYQEIYNLVKKEMGIVSKLLEHVAGRIVTGLKTQFPEIEKATVKITKMNPPMGGPIEKVSVSLGF